MKYVHYDNVHNTNAAKHIVPILIELFSPNNIIDIGCGTGTWLKVFEECGINGLLGIDGDHVNKDKLHIPLNQFVEFDLEKTINIDKKYDMLLCLEVAEHLSVNRAQGLVDDLCRISDIIIFSAAIPFQGGQNHINEQYPDYWIKFFINNNFNCYDTIRPKIWNNLNIDWWYRQNIIVFTKNKLTVSTGKSNAIEPLISQNLYSQKIEEISLLTNKIDNIYNGQLTINEYLSMLLQYFNRKFFRHLATKSF
ncbi:methyltransferase domain-containing protein [Spirosoma endbachense]|uniref:Methyltransferase domain-containing protein n=1 Tax=Spirosoma endbachense TaxID=2666025 RepID=A0A6P1VTG4_9BACT|nr:methyltransferase domain-containing protein [Spirosoma endbachense]QHV95280.1 methyltransferase domain-containing protein [Spirosoma endbachense]